MRLLFVENHAVFADVVARQFLAAHEVLRVASVAAALACAPDGDFDAILVDYDLDDGVGTAVVRALRRRGDRTPIVAISSRDDGNAALTRVGADAVCSKLHFAAIDAVLARVTRAEGAP